MRLVDDGFAEKTLEVAESPVFILFVTADAAGAAARKVVESLTEHYEERVVFLAVQAEENPTLAGALLDMDARPAAVIVRRRERLTVMGPRELADRALVSKAVSAALVTKRRDP